MRLFAYASVFFGSGRDDSCGGFTGPIKVHTDPKLNHHYSVFGGVIAGECDALNAP